MIGSAVGGIIDQIADGTGILLSDPTDLKAFGQAVRLLFADRAKATQLGLAAHAYVRENYLGDIHLMRYAELLGTLIFDDLSTRQVLPLPWGRPPSQDGTAASADRDQWPVDGSSGGLSTGAATWPARSRCALRENSATPAAIPIAPYRLPPEALNAPKLPWTRRTSHDAHEEQREELQDHGQVLEPGHLLDPGQVHHGRHPQALSGQCPSSRGRTA